MNDYKVQNAARSNEDDEKLPSNSGGRSKSIYKPVMKPPLRIISTSFFHIFRFATLFDYVLMTLGTFFSMISGLIIPLMSNFLGDIFEVFTERETGIITKQTFNQRINSLLLNFTLLGIVSFILTTCMITCWSWTGERQAKRMKLIYFNSLLKMGISYFEVNEVTSGGLLASMNKDTEDIKTVISDHLGSFVQYAVIIISCFILAFTKNAILTLVILASIPLVFITIALTSRSANPLIVKQRELFVKAGKILENALAAIKTIRAFNGEAKEEKKHYECLKEANDNVSARLAWVYAIRLGLIQFLTLSIFVQGFWFGSILVADKKLAPGGVVSVFYASLLGLNNFEYLLPKFIAMSKAKNAIRVINELLVCVSKVNFQHLNGFKLPEIKGNIKFNQVSFSYPSRPDTSALRGVTLNIPAGKTTVFVGQSGSGKSTITQLIQKLYEPSDGLILLDERELKILDTTWLRQQIGVVSQEPVLFDDTIFKNVAYGRADYWNVTMDEVIQACKLACIHDTIGSLPNGYEYHLSDMGKNLSGGQRQRIAIARAIIKDPSILILDEATSALDLTLDLKVQKALDNCRNNRTTIVVTHHLKRIRDTDFVYVMHEGEIVESGKKSELLNLNGHYSKLANEYPTDPKRNTHELKNIDLRLKRHFTFGLPSSPRMGYMFAPKATRTTLRRSRRIKKDRTSWNLDEYSDDDNEKVKRHATQRTINDIMDYYENVSDKPAETFSDNRNTLYDILSYYEKNNDDEDIVNVIVKNSDESSTTKQSKLNIFKFIRETMDKRMLYAIGICSALVEGITNPAFSFVLSNLLSTYSIPDKNELLNSSRVYAIYVLLISVVLGMSAFFKFLLLERASERWTVRLRHMGFGNALRQPQSWFDKSENATGRLATILTSDIQTTKSLIGYFVGNVIVELVSLVGGTIWSLVVGWQLALIGFGLVPVSIIFSEFSSRILQKYDSKQKIATETAANEFYQAISNIRTIYSLAIESVMESKFQTALERPFLIGIKRAFISGLSAGFLDGLTYLTKAITFWYGAQLISQGVYDLRKMLTVWTLIIFCTSSASRILSTIPYYSKCKQAIKSIQYIINLPTVRDDVGVLPDNLQGTIIFKDVNFSYAERPDDKIIDRLNLTLEPGTTVALVGKSGNGKSTIAALLQRIYEPTSGLITLDGENIKGIQLKWLRENIGIVSQEPVLFDMTISENISYGKDEATREEIEIAAKQVNMHDFISSLPNGYETKLGSSGSQLSGGERQRIAIARVLLRNPKILILDEATSALDTKNESLVQETFSKAQQGRTILMITHRLKSVKKVSKIALVEHGKIVESGNHKELMSLRREYFELIRSDNSYDH
ncbi:14167_t:CDS:1 [Funneliformis mosseae]|uniref:14167_t:CDS:1 n=1 Tax=Funneliformis mosseae TaxID=27381 RepID=A0A9N8V962_FUNMO|nr:14167_t:CDS:1 [Funneliformis mosseae]